MNNQIELSGDFEAVCIKFANRIKETQKYKSTSPACRAGIDFVLNEMDKIMLVDKEAQE